MLAALYNALLLALWMRIIPVRPEQSVGNPLVATPLNRVDRTVDLIRPAFGPRATRPFAALVLLVFALTLRGLAAQAAGGGLAIQEGPAVFLPNRDSAASCIAMSALSFGWLVQRLWLLTLAVGFLRRHRDPTPPDGLAEALGEPVSRAPRWARLALAALLATALSVATIHVAQPRTPAAALTVAAAQAEGQSAETLRFAAQAARSFLPDFRTASGTAVALMVAGSFADVFSVAGDLVFAAIVLQLAGILLRMPYAFALGTSGLEYVVGSVFRRPLRAMGMSFTPLLFLIVAALAYAIAMNLVTALVIGLSGTVSAETVRDLLRELPSAAP